MFTVATKLTGICLILLATLFLSGTARAENLKSQGAISSDPELGGQGQPVPAGKARQLDEAGSQLKQAQAQVDAAASRAQDLDEQTTKLSGDLEEQKGAASEAQTLFEERAKTAYKGEDLADVSILLESIFSGDSTRVETILDGTAARMLVRSRGSIRFNQNSKRALRETLRQLNQKKTEYRRLREEQRARVEELRQREVELRVPVNGLGTKKERMEERIAELEIAEQAGEITTPAASVIGSGTEMQEQELRIANEDIVAREVAPIPYKRYVKIYKAAAKRYEFAEDWYVLAAVGQAESNHGENMRPSSAGAMGPMQFLPSTWAEYGVDGNRDGEANIMDPEDAILAAASYLRANGAPEDWYAALYTYNRAGWYVRDVLELADAYRQQAGDDEVEPYV